MDITALGAKLSSSKVNLTIKEKSKYQQGTPIEFKEVEFVNISQMLHEFKNKLTLFESDSAYINSSTFPNDSFLTLCIHISNTFKSLRVVEFQKLINKLKTDIVTTMDTNWKKFGFGRKRSLNIEEFKNCSWGDAELKSEHILFLAKLYEWHIIVIDYAKLEREDFLGGDKGKYLFKIDTNGHFCVFIGGETIQDKIRQDLQDMACPLLDSKKPSHVKKLAKLLV